MPSNHLILCRPLLLPPSIFPSIRVFSNESVFLIRWTKYWSFSFSISPSDEYSGLISFRRDWLDFLAVQGTQEWMGGSEQKPGASGKAASPPCPHAAPATCCPGSDPPVIPLPLAPRHKAPVPVSELPSSFVYWPPPPTHAQTAGAGRFLGSRSVPDTWNHGGSTSY